MAQYLNFSTTAISNLSDYRTIHGFPLTKTTDYSLCSVFLKMMFTVSYVITNDEVSSVLARIEVLFAVIANAVLCRSFATTWQKYEAECEKNTYPLGC